MRLKIEYDLKIYKSESYIMNTLYENTDTHQTSQINVCLQTYHVSYTPYMWHDLSFPHYHLADRRSWKLFVQHVIGC